MPDTVVKKPIGPDDIQMDVAGSSTVTQFTRTKSDGTTENVDALSADQIPVLDAAVPLQVTTGGGRQPFARIVTPTDRDIEAVCKDMRKNAREMKNFEHYGGTPGAAPGNTVAKRNTEVMKKILDDIASENNALGVFFPGIEYEFANEDTLGGNWASAILAPTAQDGLIFAGGGATTLRAEAGATAGRDLFSLFDCEDVVMQDLVINQAVGSGACVSVSVDAAALTGFIFNNVTFDAGGNGLFLIGNNGGTTHNIQKVWVLSSTFNLNTSQAIDAEGLNGFTLRDTTHVGANAGMSLRAAVGAGADMTNIKIVNARLQTAGSLITVSRSVTYDSASHRNILIKDCELADGRVLVEGLNEVQINNNTLRGSDPRVSILMGAGMTFGDMMEVVNNKLFGDAASVGSNNGVELNSAVGVVVRSALLAHNRTSFIGRHGVRLFPNGGTIEGALIHDNHVYNSSTETGQHNLNDGVILEDGCVQSLVHHNQVIGTIVGLLQRYGINEVTGAASRAHHLRHNIIKGYGTNEIDFNNTGSSGTLVAPDHNIDLGATP